MNKVYVLLVEVHVDSIVVEQYLPEVFTSKEEAIKSAHDDFPELVQNDKYVVEYYAEYTNDEGVKFTAFIYECDVK